MRYFVTLVLVVFFVFLNPIIGQAKPSVSAQNAILMEQNSGRILFEKNPHQQQPIASITKIMTAIVAIESGKWDEEVTVSERAVYTEGSSIYLEEGEKMSLGDLVYGLMLRSGNDAAVAISEHIGGSVEGFVYLMNEKAKWIGMDNTNFVNPHGLHDDNHYSTAYDMAVLMRYAMENDIFRKVTETTSYKSDKRAYAWQNKNKLLTSLYEYCIGGKTGFTRAAGRTLVSAAHKEDMDLIAVTLNDRNDWQDHINMFEWGYDTYNLEDLMEEGSVTYETKTGEEITGYLHEALRFPLSDVEKDSIDRQTFLLEEINESEDVIGKSIFYLNDKPIAETSIFSKKHPNQEKGFFSTVLSLFKQIIRVG
ncbi:D-alanyl-D-alanine carboxypeptidase family protein [Oceanobacillus halotolerans]|uniref:D-alanyl-D-alanine carboxypeptidase family protein n=1 Tax=Oceanobacillus halotolerans TaxID=2663380 RepID=UPI0013DCE9DD|nr:D-alanyl-D-alanine carboxypeptidase family protein [Oceanobacillus halotolerans]